MIAIIDYGMGNLQSVAKILHRIGVNFMISSFPREIEKCDKIVLPGVGHFGKAVDNLKGLQLWDAIYEAVIVKKKPVLGICLGMQLMAKHSEEGDAVGFGWFDAEVVRFRVQDTLKYKVPHMGWNQVSITKPDPMFDGVDLQQGFYFVHSYYVKCNDPADILSETDYGFRFTSAIRKENIIGVQYHPEKSHEAGEKLLKNFVNLQK
jgi:imidazole glycerol-phosphate synthase subunit HisH